MASPAPFAITVPAGFLVAGDTKPYREWFRRLGGKWCSVLNGWWFDELLRASVMELQAKAARGELEPLKEDEVVATKARRVAPADWREDVNAAGTRAGKRWNTQEEEDLLTGLKEGKDLTILAVEHKRTESSLQGRLGEIAVRLEEDGKSEYEIVGLTGLSPEQLRVVKDLKKGGFRRGKSNTAVWSSGMPSLASMAAAGVPVTDQL